MNKDDFLKKIFSRKFLSMIAGFAFSLVVFFTRNGDMATEIASLITAFGSIAIYIFGEAMVDAKSVEKKDVDSEEKNE